MKPFVRYTALILSVVFLGGGAFACLDLIQRGATITDPLWRTAAGFLTSGAIFLALALRGLRFRNRPTYPHIKTSAGDPK